MVGSNSIHPGFWLDPFGPTIKEQTVPDEAIPRTAPDPSRPADFLPETAVSRALPDPATEPTITVPRASAILGFSRRHGYAAVERGEIPSIRVGGRVVVPTAKFLAKYGLEPTPADSAPVPV